MIIQLNPSRVRSSVAGKSSERRKDANHDNQEPVVIPSRAHVNYLPAPESLTTMISSAVAALKRGVRWDRGTILNLLV